MKSYRADFAGTPFTTNYITLQKEADIAVKKLLASPAKKLGLDIETAKLDKYKAHRLSGLCPLMSRPRLVQIYDPETVTVWVFDMDKVKLFTLAPLLQSKQFIAHNALFELKHFTHAGIPDMHVDCSMLLTMLVDRAEKSPYEPDEDAPEDEEPDGMSAYKKTGFSLDACVGRLFGVRVAKHLQTSDWNQAELSKDQIMYASLDAVLTYNLAYKVIGKVQSYKMTRHYELIRELQHVVVGMELHGFAVDWKAHSKLIDTWETELKAANKACLPYFGATNMASGKQMGEWLERYLAKRPEVLAEWPKTKKGAYTFDRKMILPYWKEPAIAALLKFKKFSKLLNTYGESLAGKKHPVTGRLHASYSIGETLTGRMSCRDPNLQNQPGDGSLRNIFIAGSGNVLVDADFSQIELRLQGELSGDPEMRKNYAEKGDLYKKMASVVYKKPASTIEKGSPERQMGKIILLALGFGMGTEKFYRQAMLALSERGVALDFSFEDAVRSHQAYRKLFKHYIDWCDQQRERATQLGFARTVLGKMRKLVPNEVYTKAVNHPVQGSATELLGVAAVKIRKELGNKGTIVALVHDEIIVEGTPNQQGFIQQTVNKEMSNAMKEMFPRASSFDVADAKIGTRWGDLKG